jgi:hypothetical protein
LVAARGGCCIQRCVIHECGFSSSAGSGAECARLKPSADRKESLQD